VGRFSPRTLRLFFVILAVKALDREGRKGFAKIANYPSTISANLPICPIS
jgi:hypothetical protein